MSNRRYNCHRCRESFIVSKETLELFEEGYIDEPDTCPDCQIFIDNCESVDFEEYSDADPGL
jgi:hypothetical protein